MEPHWGALEATVTGLNVSKGTRKPWSAGQGCARIREGCPYLLGREGEITKCSNEVGTDDSVGTVVGDGDMATPFQEASGRKGCLSWGGCHR